MFSSKCFSRHSGGFDSSEPLLIPPGHMLWQSALWQRSLIMGGGADESVLCCDVREGGVVAYAFLEVRRVALGRRGGFILGGPFFESSSDRGDFLGHITTLCRERGLDFLQIESPHTLDLPLGAYRVCIEPYTVRLDVSGSCEKALENMESKDQSAIRVSMKKGVTCRELSPTTDLPAFLALMRETALRDSFHTHSDAYFHSLIRDLGDSVKLFGAFSSDDQLTSAALVITHAGTAWYYYAASSSDSQLRKLWAPLVLQRFIIETLCQDASIHTYDLMGAAPPESLSHHLKGVTTFKKKMGPIVGPIVHSYLVPLSLWWYALRAVSMVKRWMKR